jgi:P-type conjugative transfer protein TrbJ
MMNNVFYVALIIILLFPIYGRAQMVVTDPGIYLRMAEEMQQIINQINLMESQLASINKTIETLKPDQYQWSNVQNILNDLGNTIQKTNGLSYGASNIDQQFKQYFPGYQTFTNYSQAYKEMSDKTQNTLNGVLQSIGGNASDFINQQKRLNFLQTQAQSAQGQTQALQAASQIASEQVSQLQLLRQTLMAQSNAQTTFYAYQVQKEASAQSELQKIVKAGSTTAPPLLSSSPTIKPPQFQ